MNRRAWQILSVGVDALAINAAIILSFLVRYGWPVPAFNFQAYLRVFVPFTVCQLAVFYLVDLYEPTADRSGPELLGTAAKGVVLGGLVLVTLTFVLRAFSFPRSVIAIALVLQVLLVWGWRRLAAGWLHVRWPERRVLLVGASDDLHMVAERLRTSEQVGIPCGGRGGGERRGRVRRWRATEWPRVFTRCRDCSPSWSRTR